MKKIFSGGMVLLVALAMSGVLSVEKAQAAALSSKSDTMTRLEDSTASNHTISFDQDTGTSFAATETITVEFDATSHGFNLDSLANTDPLDYDITVGGAEESIVAAGGCASNDAIEITSIATDIITFTACSSYTAAAAGSIIEIEIGTNATSPSAGDTQITNPAATGSKTIAIGGTFGDTGNLLVQIIDDDSVNVTATVSETISFSISDVEIGFGTLSSSTGRWATGTTGTDASEALPDAAHTMTIGTNAAGGYSITYNGATLTNAALDTITATTGITGDGNGIQSTEEFGICASDESANVNIATGYTRDATPDWDFVESIATELVSESGPTADEDISVSYLANIQTLTEAGTYDTDITYIATATF